MPEKNKKRPVHLDLLHIHLPVGGVVSILHRLTGVLLVLALPPGFLILQQSLAGAEDFARIRAMLQSLPLRVVLFLMMLMLAHHFFAGVRHLLLDLDIGISRAAGRRGAWLVLAGVAGTALISGGCLFSW